MEPNNQDPAKAPAQPSVPPQNETPSIPQTSDSGDDMIFYNVMPKTKSSHLIMPEIKSTVTETQPQADAQQPKDPDIWSRFKWYIILGILAVGLGLAGYYIIPQYFVGTLPENNLLVQQPVKKDTGVQNDKSQWLVKYFDKADCDPALCGDSADPDHDGLTNFQEYQYKTDPNNADGDKDGISDGDEANVFGSDPLNEHSGVNAQYTDADYIKNGYDFKTDAKYTATDLQALQAKMKQFGMHQPTLSTVGDGLIKIYKFDSATTTPAQILNPPVSTSTASSTMPKDIDLSLEAKQDRDTNRALTIKNIEIALVKYFADNKTYPPTQDFKEMHAAIKPYLRVASNPTDPINVSPYVYSYTPSSDNKDFTLTYYSESLNQVIKKTAKDAQKDKLQADASASDDQRRTDLESIRSALLVYSADNIGENQVYIFPTATKYKTALVPKYMSSIPKDPKTLSDYAYTATSTLDSFTLKAVYEAPPSGKTGYVCNEDQCTDY